MNVNGYDDLRNNCRLSFSGLPPLPQSLNGKELTTLNNTLNHSERTDELERKACSLDSHLASLKRQMFVLRQLDLSLLSQLWAVNESIQEFRAVFQENENIAVQSTSPSPTETVSLSSIEESIDVEMESVTTSTKKMTQHRMQTAPPPPPSTNNSRISYKPKE